MQSKTSIKIDYPTSGFKASDNDASFTLCSTGRNWNAITTTMYGTHVFIAVQSEFDGMRNKIYAYMPLDIAKILRDELNQSISELENQPKE